MIQSQYRKLLTAGALVSNWLIDRVGDKTGNEREFRIIKTWISQTLARMNQLDDTVLPYVDEENALMLLLPIFAEWIFQVPQRKTYRHSNVRTTLQPDLDRNELYQVTRLFRIHLFGSWRTSFSIRESITLALASIYGLLPMSERRTAVTSIFKGFDTFTKDSDRQRVAALIKSFDELPSNLKRGNSRSLYRGQNGTMDSSLFTFCDRVIEKLSGNVTTVVQVPTAPKTPVQIGKSPYLNDKSWSSHFSRVEMDND